MLIRQISSSKNPKISTISEFLAALQIIYSLFRAVLDVVVKPSSGLSGPRQRQLEQLISGCCGAVIRTKAHPHTAISITLQVENDGGSVSDVIITSRLLLFLLILSTSICGS